MNQSFFSFNVYLEIIFGILALVFNETALIMAAKFNHADIVQLLLAQEGIDVNIKNIL